MKNLLIAAFVLVMALSASAQKRTELKALDAKNYKPWEAKNTQVGYYTKTSTKKLQGPAAKNAKVWEQKDNEKLVLVKSEPREKLMGPIAKNHNVWDRKREENATAVAKK